MIPEKNILLTNIQRFSLHDGPGIRTTVFSKAVQYTALGVAIRKIYCTGSKGM